MLKLFKRIRQKLLDEGNLKKYSYYAFGEILLVVIGILIALQVNNLNEKRKTKTYESHILKDLIAGIEEDIESINFNIENHTSAVNSCKVLLNVLNENGGYHDSLARHFAATHNYTKFMNNKGPYESLKSKGFETISNKELRFQIINLNEKWYPLAKENDNDLTNDILHIKRNFNQTHFGKFQLFEIDSETFEFNGYKGEMIPNNISQLKNNVEYKYFLNSLLASHSNILSFYTLIKKMAENVIEESNAEIQKLK